MRPPDRGSWWGGGVWLSRDDPEVTSTTGLLGMGKRERDDAEMENNHRMAFGLGGANHVSHKARQAQDRAGRKNGWFSSDPKSDRYIGDVTSSSGWKKVPGKKGWFTPGKKGTVTPRKKGFFG